ncbi:MAG: hypothetical protein WC783_03675 [Candidatus Paceibacterota bacterium]|jgi:hypothetical protein
MKKENFYKIITSILISSFVVIPIAAIPQKAEAQSVSGFATGLLPAVTRLPLCKGKIKSAVSVLFKKNSAGGAVNTATSALTPEEAAATTAEAKRRAEEQLKKGLSGNLSLKNAPQQSLQSTNAAALSQNDGVQVYDSEAHKKLDQIKKDAAVTKAKVEELNANDTCYKSIGRLAIKMLLQKITISTVNWINSGFDGKPSFIQDSGKFFNDIAKNEILQFGLEINNPELFPFGKEWLRNQAVAFNNKFTDNARYSLDEMIRKSTPQYTAQGFYTDFSQGGWDAWTAMTYPGNNPLGFQLMADNEIQKRLDGTNQSVAKNTRDALQAASGFLGDLRCVDASGKSTNIKSQHKDDALAAGKPDPCIGVGTWQYVTPGKLIAEAATSTIKYPENNLLKAEDLNDAISAVMDALLSRFTTDWMEKGYANLGTDGSDGSFVYNPESERTDYSSQTEKDFTPGQLTSSWLQSNPDFNIRTDLTQALIDEQRTYADKLALQNKELNSTTDGEDYRMDTNTNTSNAYGLIPAIGQLDYCIPGPHPGFEDDSRNTLDAVTGAIRPLIQSDVGAMDMEEIGRLVQSFAPLAGAAIFASVGTFTVMGMTIGSTVPVVGTIIGAAVGAIVGAVAKFLFGLGGGPSASEKLRAYYYMHVYSLLGVISDYTSGKRLESVQSFMTKDGAVQTLNITLERYIDLAHEIFNPKVLPDVYKEASTEFYKLKGYAQMMKNNEDAIAETKKTVATLGDIKDKIDDLNQRYPEGGDDYEKELREQISVFARLSANMVNGDDIAGADNLLKQIRDERDYIYNDLLKGPYGCEKDLETGKQNLPANLYSTKRMTYPFPLIYTYDIPAGGNIPDPWKSGYNNKTNVQATNTIGPGFLSSYPLQTNGHSKQYETCKVDANNAVPTSCELRLNDILPLWGPGDDQYQGVKYIGATTPGSESSGSWESSIGVY